MAYGKDPSVEVKSLAKRYPKKGIDPTIPEGIREQLIEMEKERERKKMGEAYDRAMPSPEPGESTVRKAKGGMVSASRRADGCAQRGKTKGRIV